MVEISLSTFGTNHDLPKAGPYGLEGIIPGAKGDLLRMMKPVILPVSASE